MRSINTVYRPGKQNSRADALSQNLTEAESTAPHPIDVQVAAVENQITDLVNMSPTEESLGEFHLEQDKDQELPSLQQFL